VPVVFMPAVSFQSRADGLCHDKKARSVDGSADARSAQIRRRDGVVLTFHVSRNTVEPSKSVRARNLFSKDNDRAALCDELEPRWPKIAGIVGTSCCPDGAEGLTGTAARPDRPRRGPAGEPERIRPSANAGEEMTLLESVEVISGNINDGSRVNFAIGQLSCANQFSDPAGHLHIMLVVVRGQGIITASS
jgi:hypothetical protein